ncbi:hypothetical protein ACIA2T_04425 [Amycolatopsis japonica]|uniref:hypothetical protein n=1 Tax=Amycolatopsis japonica TaxID=208439 RepID=UPI0037B99205
MEQTEQSPDTPSAPYDLGDPGAPAPFPTLLIALFDDSGSMTGRGGNDPLANRYSEARRAFEVVARRSVRRERGAVLHFDTPCSGDVLPVPLHGHVRQVRRGLSCPRDARGSSVLEPSLRRAVAMAQGYPKHATTLLVLSDFLLLDPEPGEVLSELAGFPGDVHAVVLGDHVPKGVLDSGVVVATVTEESPPGSVAHAVFAGLTLHRVGVAAASTERP